MPTLTKADAQDYLTRLAQWGIDNDAFDEPNEGHEFIAIAQRLAPKHRDKIIELRDSAIDADLFDIAIYLSHIVQVMTEPLFFENHPVEILAN
jgi:hypothetical protein